MKARRCAATTSISAGSLGEPPITAPAMFHYLPRTGPGPGGGAAGMGVAVQKAVRVQVAQVARSETLTPRLSV